MQKIVASWALLAGLLSLPAFGQVTYSYTGKTFSFFSCGGVNDCFNSPAPANTNTSYTATDIVTGTLALAAALPANMSLQDVSGLPGFKVTLHDGHQTMSATAGYTGGFIAKVATDGLGNIAQWEMVVNCCFFPNNGIATVNVPGTEVFDQATLSAASPNNGYPNTPYDLAFNFNTPGSWTGGSGGSGGGSFPTGVFTRMTQFTVCCSGVVVDNDDVIVGGMNQVSAWGGVGSQFGQNWASATYIPITLDASTTPPTVTDNGPSVGVNSDSNQGTGFARAIAIATFQNGPTATQMKAHALLSGEFLQDVFGLPNGTLAAGATIHVFDTNQFNAAINSNTDGSDQAIGKFLIGGSATTPSLALGSLDTVIGGSLNTPNRKLYSNGPFNPPAPIADPIDTALFQVLANQTITVVFDLFASSQVGGVPNWAIGTGDVNFLDTLKPAPVFFTDANGNPIAGMKAISAPSSLPSPATSVALAPSSGSLLMENFYTVAARVADASSNPVAGAPVKFSVTAGPDQGLSAAAVSDKSGSAQFTFKGQGGAGTDTIQAKSGSLRSNVVHVTWQSAKCPQLQGFWKNNPTLWPETSLVLGDQTYSQSELLSILNNPGGADASMILAVQLIAAKLDIANGSDPSPVRSAGAAADSLLSGNGTKLPYRIKPSTPIGQSMTQTGSVLQGYTAGRLTSGCTP